MPAEHSPALAIHLCAPVMSTHAVTVRGADEPVFRRCPTPLDDLPSGVVVHADPQARLDERWLPVGEHLGGLLLHRSTPDPIMAALGVLPAAGVLAVVIHHADSCRRGCLALPFAHHLAERRNAADPAPVVPCATSCRSPEPLPEGVVRIPHLVAVEDADSGTADCAVWEVMTGADAVAWLGGPLPDQQWFEARLLQLTTVRRRLRTGRTEGRLRDGPLRELTQQLKGGYLSIRFAYQHTGLISTLLDGGQAP